MNVEAIEQEDGSLQVLLDAKPLTCSVCGNQRYHERGFMLNTRSSEYLGAAWADDKASNFICTRCGYIFWFVIKEIKRSRLGDPPELPLVDRIFGRERLNDETESWLANGSAYAAPIILGKTVCLSESDGGSQRGRGEGPRPHCFRGLNGLTEFRNGPNVVFS